MGAQLLLESWHELSESAVLTGWDCGELAEYNDDESDDSDDDSELRMCSDNDVEELRNSMPSDNDDE
jgi:hypothetical protein